MNDTEVNPIVMHKGSTSGPHPRIFPIARFIGVKSTQSPNQVPVFSTGIFPTRTFRTFVSPRRPAATPLSGDTTAMHHLFTTTPFSHVTTLSLPSASQLVHRPWRLPCT